MTFMYERDETGQYICPTCGVKKRIPSTMNMHRKKCEGVLPYKCSACEYKCLSKQRVDLHIAAKHPAVKMQNALPRLKCPDGDCTFETLTNGNRVIHFMRKHCYRECMNIMDDTEGGIDCARCKRSFQSNTAFQYHATHCITLTDVRKAEYLKAILA